MCANAATGRRRPNHLGGDLQDSTAPNSRNVEPWNRRRIPAAGPRFHPNRNRYRDRYRIGIGIGIERPNSPRGEYLADYGAQSGWSTEQRRSSARSRSRLRRFHLAKAPGPGIDRPSRPRWLAAPMAPGVRSGTFRLSLWDGCQPRRPLQRAVTGRLGLEPIRARIGVWEVSHGDNHGEEHP